MRSADRPNLAPPLAAAVVSVFCPADLGFKVEYVRPYCWGDKDPQRTVFKTSAFNSRKLSPVFTGGPLSDEVPGVWVVRPTHTARLSRAVPSRRWQWPWQ